MTTPDVTVEFAGHDGWNDLIEWYFGALEIGLQVEPQGQVSARELPWNGDPAAA